MKRFTYLLLGLMAMLGTASAEEGIDLTKEMYHIWNGIGANATITSEEDGDCAFKFGESTGQPYGTGSVWATHYADLSGYKVLTLTVTNGIPRLMLNRVSDDGEYLEIKTADNQYVKVVENVWYVNLAKIKSDYGYVHLNAIKGANWANVTITEAKLYAEMINDEIFPEVFELPEGEINIIRLPWVNEGQGCANNLGIETGDPIYGTDAGPADGQLSYFDITNYATIKLYGHAGDVVRLFINRAEGFSDFQFYVTIGEDGVGAFNLAEIYATQAGAEYIHLNGVKSAATWQGSPTGKAKVDYISLIEKPFTLPEGEIDITTLAFVGNIEANNIGNEIVGGQVIYGDQNNGDNFHVDVTEYKEVKIYGTTGALVRVFVNREGTGDVHEQKVAIGENGIGVLDIETVMTTLGTNKVWINCFKNAAAYQGGTNDPVTFKAISVKDAVRTIPEMGLASFSCVSNVEVPEDVAVYKAEVVNANTVKLTKVETSVIPANTGVVLYSETAGEKTFTLTSAESTGDFSGNALIATSVVDNATIPAEGTCYALKTTAREFAKVASGTKLSSNKAYLKVTGAAPAKLNVVFDGEEVTGIVSVQDTDNEQNTIFNIAGQKVGAGFKGIVIKNGKKTVIK